MCWQWVTLGLWAVLGPVATVYGQSIASRPSGVTLVAPSVAEPALVAPGDTLSILVRLATALTPPPGVQQPRALREWSASLIGNARPIATAAEHRYLLHVINVRPETSHSLTYRVKVALPAWIAPGHYALALSGPGGSVEAANTVSIVLGTSVPEGGLIALRAGADRLATLVPGVRWYPATTVGSPAQAPAVVGWLPPGVAADSMRVRPAQSSEITVAIQPSPRAGARSTLTAVGVPKGAQIAWSLSDGTTAFGPGQLDHLFGAAGELQGSLMAIGPDGAATSADFRVAVSPGLRFGCSSQPGIGWPSAPIAFAPLILALALLKRRPRRRPGID